MVNRRSEHSRRFGIALWLIVPAAFAASCGSGPNYVEIVQLTVVDRQVAIVTAAHEERDGPELVRVRDVDAGTEEPPLYLGEVANGGEDLTVENIRPDASDAPNLRLCLNGSGQNDLYVRINVYSKTVTEIPRECAD